MSNHIKDLEKGNTPFEHFYGQIKTRKRYTPSEKGHYLAPPDENGNREAREMAITAKTETVVNEPFLKAKPEGIKILIGLGNQARILAGYFLEKLQEGKTHVDGEVIHLDYKSAQFDHGYEGTRQQFYKGMKELKNVRFIVPVEGYQGYFWMNPAYFYNGNELDHFK